MSKGLSFVPTTYANDFETTIDFQKFFRGLRLREFFHSGRNDQSEIPVHIAPQAETSPLSHVAPTPFKKKSTFIPPRNRNASLDTYCRLVENDVKSLLKKKKEYKVYNNMSKEERDALHDLSKDNKVIVRPADKGGAIVLQNVGDYEMEIKKQLTDSVFYEKLPSDPSKRLKSHVHSKLLLHFNNAEFDKSTHDFLKVEHPVIPVFYTLPKIHKGLDTPVKGRPIVSGIDSLTENISAYVDHFIKSEVVTLPSYVKDSIDLIKLLKSFDVTTDELLLVTFDVQSLYTNIPHQGGIEALQHFLSLRPPMSKPSLECILDLADIVLSNNFFRFQNEFYIQKKGTAMGSKMAPNYACLYMGLFEKEHVLNPVNPFYSQIRFYKRFIDDIFLIMESTVDELTEFHNYLNSCNEHLKFTVEYDRHSISFLDVRVYREEDQIKTDLFRKPTDRNTILRGDSFHPSPLLKSLPVSQFHRIRRICSDDPSYSAQAEVLKNRFLSRGYKEEWVDAAKERFDQSSQDECLIPKVKNKKHKNNKNNQGSSPNCCVKYSPLASEFKHTIHKHWHIIESDEALKKVFPDKPKMIFKRAANLRDTLVKSDMRPQNPLPVFLAMPDGNYKCGNCAQCSYTHKCKFFSHPHTGKNISIRGAITCSTTHVVYLIRCPCGLAYVGKTTRPLRTRMSEHRSSIRTEDERSPVAAHFKRAGHAVSALRYIGVERVDQSPRGGDRDKKLLQRETFWIYFLNTLSPHGLNEDFDIKPFL